MQKPDSILSHATLHAPPFLTRVRVSEQEPTVLSFLVGDEAGIPTYASIKVRSCLDKQQFSSVPVALGVYASLGVLFKQAQSLSSRASKL